MLLQPLRYQLISARKIRGLTHAQLADRCKPPLDASTISKIESGKLDPKTSTLARIAQALGCHVVIKAIEVPDGHAFRDQVAQRLVDKFRHHGDAFARDVIDELFGPIE